ncbi:YciI family protein [Spongiactinospora gelatinilytica]|uniref:YciI family protein n=1 Tax=Spongiactinospora gelatinilytica TaxID=2666298 RepID=UPI001F45E434|nr:YciI family protein [Spongiactinospora gelatinilytica]
MFLSGFLEWIGGEALADPFNSRTVRVRDGVPAVTDGPYLEAKEHLAGYCLVECESLERATADRRALAGRPLHRHGGPAADERRGHGDVTGHVMQGRRPSG